MEGSCAAVETSVGHTTYRPESVESQAVTMKDGTLCPRGIGALNAKCGAP